MRPLTSRGNRILENHRPVKDYMAADTFQRIVIGYHGCDAAVAAKVLAGTARLNLSTNAYDWLGEGIYFWEHGPQRAREWAIEQAKLSGAKIKQPSVLGARINLGEVPRSVGHRQYPITGQVVLGVPQGRP